MQKLEFRKNTIIYFFIALAVLLVLKTAQLQIFDATYRDQAKKTTLDQQTIYPSRGLVYDRNNQLLVANSPIYNIEVIYRNINPKMDTLGFCSLLGIDRTTFEENLNKDWSSPQFHKSVPFIFLAKVSPEQYARFKEHLHKFPGFYPVLKNVRTYPQPYGAHVLGYLSEVNKLQVETSNKLYAPGDYIGASGIEKSYETDLLGIKGVAYVMKDNLGRRVGPFDDGKLDSSAIAGENLISGLDIALQAYGELLMTGKRGAIVAIEPSTGEILAMISSPTYDPNLISLNQNRGQVFTSLLTDTINKPLFDRSIRANYPPGSIFKCIFSLVALQTGVTTPNRTISCSGAYAIGGGKVQKCHSHSSATSISMAIQHSCNTYYYHLMRETVNKYGANKPGIGLDTLVSYLRDFGIGSKLGVDINYENDGFIPDSKFYDKLYSREVNGWRATYMLSLGIGQGELQVTTLQMANLAAIIANRGHFFTPHLIKGFQSGSHALDKKYTTPNRVRIDKKHFEPVVHGMEMAVLAGTARIAALDDISVCGKTGTSQNGFGKKDHSVFFGFAPKDNPKIAIAAFVENAGWGASFATPIASLMIEKYLTDTIRQNRLWLEDKMIKSELIEVNPLDQFTQVID